MVDRKAADRRYYLKNKEHYNKRNAEHRKKIRAWFAEYKSKLHCSQCSECRPAALQFHHTGEKKKRDNVSVMVMHGLSRETILKEIAKCIALCANCHSVLEDEKRKAAD